MFPPIEIAKFSVPTIHAFVYNYVLKQTLKIYISNFDIKKKKKKFCVPIIYTVMSRRGRVMRDEIEKIYVQVLKPINMRLKYAKFTSKITL